MTCGGVSETGWDALFLFEAVFFIAAFSRDEG